MIAALPRAGRPKYYMGNGRFGPPSRALRFASRDSAIVTAWLVRFGWREQLEHARVRVSVRQA